MLLKQQSRSRPRRNYMAQRRTRIRPQPDLKKLLEKARRRAALPDGELFLDYAGDVDTLYIRLKKNARPTHSDDAARGLVFDYEGKNLVGIEVLNVSD